MTRSAALVACIVPTLLVEALTDPERPPDDGISTPFADGPDRLVGGKRVPGSALTCALDLGSSKKKTRSSS
jgi:hypothetical protein